ncbi:MAG: carboxypeptidase Taq [Thermomicrobiales bacterium]|nr:carboxypeptidase Taq [Thermomicrobiales bacterium]
MEESYNQLKQRLAEVKDLDAIAGLMGWDQQTMMPPRGAGVRAEQMATIARLSHERFTDDEIGRLLNDLTEFEASLLADSDEASLIRVTRRDWNKARRVPTELAAELAHAAASGYEAWITARASSDFAKFLPALERNVEVKRRYIACFEGAPYDVLLDDFEPGLTTGEVSAVFDRLKAGLRPLVERIAARPDAVDDSCLTGDFPSDRQRALVLRIIERFGYNPEGWRLDPTAHPFAQSLATTDIRLTTRYDERNLAMALFGTIHECGHGLYEEGISPSLERTPLAHGCSMALHESQSRLWENLVGRGRPFWRFAFPLLREAFPDHFAAIDDETVYRAVNKMRPSLIRVEADEVTYPLHIILRFELERDLFEGDLSPTDLPDAWNTKMREYLGVEVPDVANGVLQDVHWSAGLFGYFPTYALGTVVAGQIWERVRVDLPELDEQFARGEFLPLREWLREHLHQDGRKFTPKETIARVAGGPIDPEPFLRYVTARVEEFYGG